MGWTLSCESNGFSIDSWIKSMIDIIRLSYDINWTMIESRRMSCEPNRTISTNWIKYYWIKVMIVFPNFLQCQTKNCMLSNSGWRARVCYTWLIWGCEGNIRQMEIIGHNIKMGEMNSIQYVRGSHPHSKQYIQSNLLLILHPHQMELIFLSYRLGNLKVCVILKMITFNVDNEYYGKCTAFWCRSAVLYVLDSFLFVFILNHKFTPPPFPFALRDISRPNRCMTCFCRWGDSWGALYFRHFADCCCRRNSLLILSWAEKANEARSLFDYTLPRPFLVITD